MIALYLLGAVLVLLVTAALLAPLFLERGPEVELEDLPPAERREAALEALRELTFEHETGKLADAEYESLRSRLGKVALAAEEEAEAGDGDGDGEEARGATEDRPPVAVREAEATCRRCGRELPPRASFCPGCGRPAAGERGA